MNLEAEILIQKFLDGQTSAGENASLSELLESSQNATRTYLELAEIHAALAAEESLRTPIPVIRTRPRRPLPPSIRRPLEVPHPRRLSPWLSASAALIAISAVTYLGWKLASSSPPALSSPPAIALIATSASAVWTDASLSSGSSLSAGPLTLSSGMAAIEFTSGARMLLEAPASVDLISNMEIHLHEGKARVHVPPPAHGFAISTPATKVIDLGTTFGLAVQHDGSTRIKVMEGTVELHHLTEPLALTNSDAKLITRSGETSDITLPDNAFPSEESLAKRTEDDARISTSRWLSASQSLASDPAALLILNFSGPRSPGRTAANLVPHSPVTSHATLVGTGWTEGRWTNKSAVEFNGRSDRLLFKLNSSSPSATYLAWLRVDSLPNLYNILLMPDTSRPSALQWMILKSGEIRLAITNDRADPGSSKGWEPPVKSPAVSNKDLGRWIFLASTYDSSTGTVIHYRDGRPIGRGSFPEKLPVVFDQFSFGNWPVQSAHASGDEENFRNFTGCLDELAILARALSPEEIDQFYQNSKP